MADESAPENLDETPVPPTHSGRTLAMRFGLALGLMLLLILPTVFDAWRQKKRESTVTKADLQLFVANDPMYMENSYTIYTQAGGPCWIVDPGLPPQAATIAAHIRENDLKPQAILLTHGHADHIAGIDELREAVGAIPVYMAQEEWAALTEPDVNLSSMMGAGLTTAVTDPVGLEHGQVLELDGLTWQVLDTAGHSPGGRSFYCKEAGVVIVGDALFAGSVGRTDFPTSSSADLIRNIRAHLLNLPDDTRVLSGHGPQTTVKRERETNPFLRDGML